MWRATPRQQRSRDRVATILAVTSRLLVECGFDALNTRQIAAAAGLPPSLLYHYFPNKGAIVKALAQRTVMPLRRELTGLLSEVKIGFWREALRRLVTKMVRTYRREPAAGAIMEALQSDPDLKRFNHEMNDDFAQMFVRFFRAAGAEIHPRGLLRIARLVIVVFDAVVPDLVAASPREAQKIAAEVSTLLVGYLGAYLR